MPADVRSANGAARLAVSFVLPSFAAGGAERVLITLASALDPSRFAARLVVLDEAGAWKSLVPAHLPVTVLGKTRIRHAVPALVGALRRHKPDVVVSTIGALNLALLAVRPFLPGMRLVVREANTPHRHAQGRWGKNLYRWAYPRLYSRADRVIVPARYLAAELARDFAVPAAKIEVLANPVDVAALRKAAAPPRRKEGQGRRFVAVGRLTAQKGFDRLIGMMAAAPADSTLTILGEGPERVALEAQREQRGLAARIALPGFAMAPAPQIAGADALLLPSRWEGLPNVALEALALGTPVIAAPEAGGISDIAAAAPKGAVTLAEVGAAFVAAMAAIEPRPTAALRETLLPQEFWLPTVVSRLSQMIAVIAHNG